MLQERPEAFSHPVVLPKITFYPQERYQCGPAALATVLQASGVDTTPSALVPLVYVPERKGSFQVELVAAARSLGRLAYKIPPTLTALYKEINAGTPVLVMQNLGLGWYPKWHFAVVKGYDLGRRALIMNSGTHEDYAHSMRTFERTWARADHWAIVILTPGQIPASAEPGQYFIAVAALERSGDPAAIRNAWISGLNKWPTDRKLMMGYANHLYQQGDSIAASNQFEQIIDTHPEYAPAYNNLGQLLYEQGHEKGVSSTSRRRLNGAATLLTITVQPCRRCSGPARIRNRRFAWASRS
ncbi:MAG: PA2778 family cysteine peptidase [Gammaproteobacteria bacterium]|nr:PA2778 family cysteine peptidase [Gammaproteobacteria bacterium]